MSFNQKPISSKPRRRYALNHIIFISSIVNANWQVYSRKQKKKETLPFFKRPKQLWLTMGDENTKFFHHSINQRRKANTINVLHLGDGVTSDRRKIQEAFQSFYQNLLCTDMKDRRPINMNVILNGVVLLESHQNLLSLNFSGEDIKKAPFGESQRTMPQVLMASIVGSIRLHGK